MKIEDPKVSMKVIEDALTTEAARKEATRNVLQWFNQIDAQEEIVPIDKPSELLALMIDAKGGILNRNELSVVREMCG
ncbi:hypothetical protein N7E81_16525 [Reichenbachiella carrageenanivorans]|uniref:Tellurite resistance protein TerB n=1 Tax=Reichenbachiella carrageenanivorans TaxID=2979869 RepID=A0ABY6CZZ7_9BACT|nr:hypothetical protein [Reichenbachiella carrageenanivorans]UXX78960.1 hypothetical protein N7E81_16525 [Reichenbachiella carrageenanivorans]